MNLKEKISYLQDKHFGDWLRTRKVVADEVSEQHSMWCVCGKLCTGLHESYCRKFQNKITNETAKKLSYLIEAK